MTVASEAAEAVLTTLTVLCALALHPFLTCVQHPCASASLHQAGIMLYCT